MKIHKKGDHGGVAIAREAIPRELASEERIRGSAMEQSNIHDQWLGFVERQLFHYTLGPEYPKERSFAIEAYARSVSGWTIGRVTTTAGKSQLVRQQRDIAADARERYMLYISLQNEIEFKQFGRQVKCPAGTLTLVSGGDPLTHLKNGDNDTLCFGMPREFVDQRIVRAEHICTTLVTAEAGLGALVKQSLLALEEGAPAMSEIEFLSAARIISDLALLSLGSSADQETGTSFVRSSNLARAKRVVRERLSDPDLTPADIAAECGISLSYLHNLFRDDGRTVREYLVAERLQRARHMLQNGLAANVTDAAMACGFSNPSSFSTVFRSAFGVSPREVFPAGSGRLN